MAGYIKWFVILVIIIAVICVVFAFIWGNNNDNNGNNDGGNIVVENRVQNRNRARRRGNSNSNSNLPRSRSCGVSSNDSIFSENGFDNFGNDDSGLDRAALQRLTAAKLKTGAADLSTEGNILLTQTQSGVQGPEGPEGVAGVNGSGGRVDIGIVPYSGVFQGLPLPKRLALGFGSVSTVVFAPEAAPANRQNSPIDEEIDANAQRYYRSPDEIKSHKRLAEDAHLVEERDSQVIGSFWLNPTTQTLRLTSLRASALSNDLIAVPGTLLNLQIMLAAPGGSKFVAIGPPFVMELSTASGKLTCFGAPAVIQDIPISPGTMVSLTATTSSHVRGFLNIGAALAYV